MLRRFEQIFLFFHGLRLFHARLKRLVQGHVNGICLDQIVACLGRELLRSYLYLEDRRREGGEGNCFREMILRLKLLLLGGIARRLIVDD